MPNFLRLLCLLCIACVLTQARADEDWNAKFQTTYIVQKKSAFAAAYSGANSLSPSAEKSYTFSTDAFLAWRVQPHTELYFVPEVTQGVALSNLTGMAGFTNGEITRASGTNPTLYRQQLFVRHSWGLGGAVEQLASGMNQLASTVDTHRLVLTAGNFSTLNLFDNNRYAHDPRSQFMNWSNMTHAAYDYAADARGFGWGVAGEWYGGEWVLRAARMTVPRTPNGLPLDEKIFSHYGDQIEFEHSHQLGTQPGKMRLLAWRNRAVLASYREAILLGATNNSAPDIAKVRQGEKIKYGIGINLEQAINADTGIFLRAMLSDGRSETLAFTEADHSIAGGVVVQGAAWGRAQDSVGLSLMANALGADRRAYLQAGGISFFIGDGGLRYRMEKIAEGYYSWGIAKDTALTADYQYIANPAYNAERGPLSVLGMRLHLEY